MWQALINLINRMAHRCEHDWTKIGETATYFSKRSTTPYNRTKNIHVHKMC